MLRKSYTLEAVPEGRKRRKRTALPPCSRLVHEGNNQCRVVYAPWKALRDFGSMDRVQMPNICVTRTIMDNPSGLNCASTLLYMLRHIEDFPVQNRPRVCDLPVHGVVLGKAAVFDKRDSTGRRPIVVKNTRATEQYGHLWQAACAFMQAVAPTACFTSVQINKCTMPCKLHVDRRNFGPSYIIALGSFTTGGQLQLLNFEVDIHNKLLSFNGQLPHRALPHAGGDRYSLVFFNVGGAEGRVQSRSVDSDLIDVCTDSQTVRVALTEIK